MQVPVEPPFVLVKPVEDEGAYYALGEDSSFELLDGRLVTAPASLVSEVLPGWWLDVGWLWADPLPSTLRCLRQLLR